MNNKFIKLVSLGILSISFCSAVQASDIKKYCSPNYLSPDLYPGSHKISKLHNQFGSQKQREEAPEKLISLLDGILLSSPFSSIIKCKEQIKSDPNFDFRIKFQDVSEGNQNMAVKTDYLGSGEELITRLNLEFNLVKSAQRVLFVYLHEMVHVCQRYNSTAKIKQQRKKSWKKLSLEEQGTYKKASSEDWGSINASSAERLNSFEHIDGEFSRWSFYGEIEAFYYAQKAYGYFTERSPRFCYDENLKDYNNPKIDLYEVYIRSELKLKSGTFSQVIVQWYLKFYKPKLRFIFNLASQSKVFNSFEGTRFKMKEYNSQFRKLLRRIKIKTDGGTHIPAN